MSRPVTLFTGQWADLPLADLAEKVAAWGYDGVELACWGDHFEVERALADDGYVDRVRELLARHELGCWSIGAHLVGQAVCDGIDARHEAVLPAEVWGHGDIDFEAFLRSLNGIGYRGPLSVEWEDAGMDREWGARDALRFVRAHDFEPAAQAFDAAFQGGGR